MYTSPVPSRIVPAIRRRTSRGVSASATPVVSLIPLVLQLCTRFESATAPTYSTVAALGSSWRIVPIRCSRANPRATPERRIPIRGARTYVKTMVYLYQLYAYAGSSTFADFSSDFPPLSPPFFFIDTTYPRIFVALNHYMVYRYCSSTTGAPKVLLGTRRRMGQRKRKTEREREAKKEERYE